MISSERLALIAQQFRSNPDLLIEFREEVSALYASAPYQKWLSGGLAERRPFEIRDGLRTHALGHAGLVSEHVLQLKINGVGARLFVTDGVWIPQESRVFPFADESLALLKTIERRGLGRWADLVIDLAAGCGHNVFGMEGVSDRIALDVSPRAMAYLAINRELNNCPPGRSVIALNDIRNGIPETMVSVTAEHVLLLANMPFGPTPARGILPPTSDGGATGADLQIFTMDAIAHFARRGPAARAIRAFLLALTVGDAAAERWEVVERARSMFGAENVRWELLSQEKIFRISGFREQDNPSPLALCLPRIADCRLYVREQDSDAFRASYKDLARTLEKAGWHDMAYGVVEIAAGTEAR